MNDADIIREQTDAIERLVQTAERRIEAKSAETDTRLSQVLNNIEKLQERLDHQQGTAGRVASTLEKFEKDIEGAADSLNAVREEVIESARLSSSVNLWNDQATQNNTQADTRRKQVFWVGLGIAGNYPPP